MLKCGLQRTNVSMIEIFPSISYKIIFSQMKRKKNRLYYPVTSGLIVFVRFLGELRRPKITFEIQWPLVTDFVENLINSSKLRILVSIEFQFQATARDRVQLMKKKINTQSKSFFSCIIYSFLMIWCRFPIPHSKWVNILFECTFLSVCVFEFYTRYS